MLCIYAERNPMEWTTWIPIIQQACNTRLHMSIGCSPYKALFGYNEELQWNHKMKPEDHMMDIQSLHKQIQENLDKAQQKMSKFANRKRRGTYKPIQEGDKVMINSKQLK